MHRAGPLTPSDSNSSLKRAHSSHGSHENLKSSSGASGEKRRPIKRSKAAPAPLPPSLSFQEKPAMPTASFPLFSGNFDLYGMFLPFLQRAFLPPEESPQSPVDYAALYETILNHQAKHDYTARCYLGPYVDQNALTPSIGRFESPTILDPMMERPFDIDISSFVYRKILTYTPSESYSFIASAHSPSASGVVAQTTIYSQCGIKTAKGIFKLKRVWIKPGTNSGSGASGHTDVKELYEGFFSFNMSYDSLYRKAGHGNGAKYKFAFWAVRALRDNAGKEIGLGPRKLSY